MSSKKHVTTLNFLEINLKYETIEIYQEFFCICFALRINTNMTAPKIGDIKTAIKSKIDKLFFYYLSREYDFFKRKKIK